MQGVFIVIDGVDGSGKSTIIKKLAEDLPKERTFVTREPFNRARMKEFFSKPNAIQRKEEALKMYTEDRKHHAKIIQTHLEAGNIVVCDRYKYATYAYQTAQELPFELVHETQKDFMAPDVAIIIDLPANETMKRMKLTINLPWNWATNFSTLGNGITLKFSFGMFWKNTKRDHRKLCAPGLLSGLMSHQTIKLYRAA